MINNTTSLSMAESMEYIEKDKICSRFHKEICKNKAKRSQRIKKKTRSSGHYKNEQHEHFQIN